MREEIVKILEPAEGEDRVVEVKLEDIPQGFVKVEYNNDIYWMNPEHIDVGDIKQKPFIGELKRKIIKLADQLQEVLPKTCEEWEDSLRREPDPEEEINRLFFISNQYNTLSKPLKTYEEKKEMIKILFECAFSEKNKMLKTFKPRHLTHAQSTKAIKRYFKEWT